MTDEEDQIDTEALGDEAVVGFEDEQQDDDVVVAFSDDEQDEETPLVKKLRDQLREAHRRNNRPRAEVSDNDPEPTIPDRPRSVTDFDYDEDRFNAAVDAHIAAKEEHSAWKSRQSERENARAAAAHEQAKRVEQQKRALGVRDYDARAATVTEVLSEAQLAILSAGIEDPARMIAALGAPGAQARLSQLASEENLARFAVMLGKMDKEIKVIKKSAPAPETMVRGATATLTQTEDKHLAKLEKEAEKTNDRSKIAEYRREQRRKQAA